MNKVGKNLSREKTIATMKTLSQIISSDHKKVEYFNKIGGFQIIINIMKYNDKLAKIYLKTFINTAKKNKKLRLYLLQNNIFHLLAGQLRNKSKFSNDFLLCAVFVIILVNGNTEAQNQVKESGCLSCLLEILSDILDEGKNTSVPWRNIELITYAVIVSIKNPRHPENQLQVGWIMPKILFYLEEQDLDMGNDQLNLVKGYWSLLKSILDQNEVNQKIFIHCFGPHILLRCIQQVIEEEKQESMSGLLLKMTGLLVKLKSQKDFLEIAFNYCPLLILCSLLKSNRLTIIQHIITFLDSLAQEFPDVLKVIQEEEISKIIQNSKISLSKWNSGQNERGWTQTGDEPNSDFLSQYFPLSDDDLNRIFTKFFPFEDSGQKLNSFCVLHDLNFSKDFSDYLKFPKMYSEILFKNGNSMGNPWAAGSSTVQLYFPKNLSNQKEIQLFFQERIPKAKSNGSKIWKIITVENVVTFFSNIWFYLKRR